MAHRSRTQVRKDVPAPKQQEPAAELVDVNVTEVSTVGTPANGRKFLVVKDAAGAERAVEVEPDGKGGLRPVAKEGDAPAPAAKGAAALYGKAFAVVREKFDALAAATAALPPDAAKLPMEHCEAEWALHEALWAARRAGSVEGEVVAAIAKGLDEKVAKAGRVMAKARLERLKALVDGLVSFLQDLDPAEAEEAADVVAEAAKGFAPAAPAAPAPDVAARVDELAKLVEGLGAKVAEAVGKNADALAAAEAVGKRVDALAAAQQKAAAVLEKVAKSHLVSNVETPDGDPSPPPARAHQWPVSLLPRSMRLREEAGR